METSFGRGEVRATIGDRSVLLRIENLPKEFYIGITGCENINRIYSVNIEDVADAV